MFLLRNPLLILKIRILQIFSCSHIIFNKWLLGFSPNPLFINMELKRTSQESLLCICFGEGNLNNQCHANQHFRVTGTNIMGNHGKKGIIEFGKCWELKYSFNWLRAYYIRIVQTVVLRIICGGGVGGIQIQEFQNEFSSNKFAWSFVKSASPAGPVQFILKDKCLFILEKINGVLCIGIFKMRVSA